MSKTQDSKIDVTILLPTHNEADNIEPLLLAISSAMKHTPCNYEILFVDDSSDITPIIIARVQKIYPNVRLYARPKEKQTGLATAFVDGFTLASGEYILCMDSDLQHPPRTIPHLIEAIMKSGVDIAVATRYAPGGSAEGLGSRYRRLVSHLCRLASWMMLAQTRKTSDPGSGFFLFRKNIVDNMDFKGLRGFKILIDILARTADASVVEVPYTFLKRLNNESKATFKQGISFLTHLFSLKAHKIRQVMLHRKKGNFQNIQKKFKIDAKKETLWALLADGLVVVFLIALGWYLVGYYASFNYLYTGYEDWIYHAFRVRSLQEYGMVSWDHVWSNGVNYWRLYQYVAHLLMLVIVKVTGLPVTKVLLLSLVTIYIGLRAMLYIILRVLGIQRVFAILPVVASYTIVQEWGSMQDYSIYVAFAIFPLFLLLWIKTFRNLQWIYLLAVVTGLLWSFHPVLGFNASILLGFLTLFSRLKSDMGKMVRVGVMYLLGATPFLASYLTAGYFFTNPIFKSYVYLSTSVLSAYAGLSMLYWMLFGISWILVLWRSHLVPTWTKVLLVYATFYFILIFLGQRDYLPSFLVQFQFSRGITAVAFALVLVFGSVLETTVGQYKSLTLKLIATVLIATGTVHAVDIASRYYVSPPVNEIQNPVATYFKDKDIPQGSVFVDNVSEATYFSKEGIRFVTSYNEHMQPHPYSTRLRLLMHNRLGYTGISQSHITNIENYSTVLGIQYLFLPATSPLVDGLTKKEDSLFEVVDYVDSEPLTDSIAVLKYIPPVINAFAIERMQFSESLWHDALPLPTVNVASYAPWDDRIAEMAHVMRSNEITPLHVDFVPTNILRVTPLEASADMSYMEHPIIIVGQSYDKNWNTTDVLGDHWKISPTTLRLIALEKTEGNDLAATPIELKNTWPWWHWPAQSVGSISVIIVLLFSLKRNGSLNHLFKKLTD